MLIIKDLLWWKTADYFYGKINRITLLVQLLRQSNPTTEIIAHFLKKYCRPMLAKVDGATKVYLKLCLITIYETFILLQIIIVAPSMLADIGRQIFFRKWAIIKSSFSSGFTVTCNKLKASHFESLTGNGEPKDDRTTNTRQNCRFTKYFIVIYCNQ